jgi:hypothetical protein
MTAINTKKTQIRVPRSRGRTVTIPPPPIDEEVEEIEEEPKPRSPSDLDKLKMKTNKKSSEEETEEVDGGDGGEEEAHPSQPVFTDRFVLQFEGIEAFRIKNVELPKIIFAQHKNSQSIKEKSTVMVYFYTMPADKGNNLYPYKQLFETCKKNVVKVSIKWLDEKGNISSEWVFGGARIQGIDFGSAAYEKPEPSEGAVELSYQTINIDGIEF